MLYFIKAFCLINQYDISGRPLSKTSVTKSYDLVGMCQMSKLYKYHTDFFKVTDSCVSYNCILVVFCGLLCQIS